MLEVDIAIDDNETDKVSPIHDLDIAVLEDDIAIDDNETDKNTDLKY